MAAFRQRVQQCEGRQPLAEADSTGRRNTFAESLSGRLEAERLARPSKLALAAAAAKEDPRHRRGSEHHRGIVGACSGRKSREQMVSIDPMGDY